MKIYDHMKKENICLSVQTSIAVLDTLSMYGHGSLVADVLSLIENDLLLAKGTLGPE